MVQTKTAKCLMTVVLMAGVVLQGAEQSGPDQSQDTRKLIDRTQSNDAGQLYILGPEDVLVVNGVNAEDLVGKPMQIDAKGDLSFPLVGTVHAGGLTVHQLEQTLNTRLAVFVKNPQLVATVTEYKSQPVSVVGAVNSPGLHQIQGRKTLVEMISLAGGPRIDAGSVVTVTRPLTQGRLPLPNAHLDQSGLYSTVDLSLRDITGGSRPDENITVKANDVIAISRASTVYVIGDVKKAGGFVLGDDNQLTVIQALALAQGNEHTADLKHARIIRNSRIPGQHQEIFCDLTKILKGKTEDIGLQAQDILYVPGSTGKRVALRAIEAAVSTGSGIAIYGLR